MDSSPVGATCSLKLFLGHDVQLYAGLPTPPIPIQAARDFVAGVPVESPLELYVDDIGPRDLEPLARLIHDSLPKLGRLELRFGSFEHACADDLRALARLWQAFSRPAPKLESLALLAGKATIYSLPFCFMNGTPPTKLQRLHITGFKIEEPCPAFASVERVQLDLGVVEGFNHDRLSLGELFAGADLIHLDGLESYLRLVLEENGDEGTMPYSYLHCVPAVTAARPVNELILEWAPTGSPSNSPCDANWVANSAPYVGSLTVFCPEHEDVRLRTLETFAPQATEVALWGSDARGFTKFQLTAQGQFPSLMLPDAMVAAQFAYLGTLRSPASVTRLLVDSARLHALVGVSLPPEGFPRLRHLEIRLDFPNAQRPFYFPQLLRTLPRFDRMQKLTVTGSAEAVLTVMNDATAGLPALKEALVPYAELYYTITPY